MTVHPPLDHLNQALQLCPSGSPIPKPHHNSLSIQKCLLQLMRERNPTLSNILVQPSHASQGAPVPWWRWDVSPTVQLAFQSFKPSPSLLLKESSGSNQKLGKLSWWPNTDSQVEGYKTVCYLPAVLTKRMTILIQTSFWTLRRREIASGEKH